MSLIKARKIIRDDIISKMKKIWEHIKLFAEQKYAIKTTKFLILSSKYGSSKNARTIEKFIRYLIEKLVDDLREMDIIDRTGVVIEVSKMIQRRETRDRAKECVNDLEKLVATFYSSFD